MTVINRHLLPPMSKIVNCRARSADEYVRLTSSKFFHSALLVVLYHARNGRSASGYFSQNPLNGRSEKTCIAGSYFAACEAGNSKLRVARSPLGSMDRQTATRDQVQQQCGGLWRTNFQGSAIWPSPHLPAPCVFTWVRQRHGLRISRRSLWPILSRPMCRRRNAQKLDLVEMIG